MDNDGNIRRIKITQNYPLWKRIIVLIKTKKWRRGMVATFEATLEETSTNENGTYSFSTKIKPNTKPKIEEY